MATSYLACVGSRTTKERNARGNGINVYLVDATSGEWKHQQLVEDLVNPSYLCFDRTRRYLYTVHGDLSEVSAFEFGSSGAELKFLNRVSTEGKNPVHLTVDPTNRFLIVANHITSTVAVLQRRDDGSLGSVVDLATLTGKIGPHRVEQPFAKPHQVEFDPGGRFIVVPDKGLDAIFTFTLDHGGKLTAIADRPVASREGSGPRHVAFHPTRRFVYAVNELDSTVAACAFDERTGAIRPLQILPSLPDDFVGNSRASEIAVSGDGRFVYVSNRGFDSIAIFAVDPATGRLVSRGWQMTEGRTPRFFAIAPDGRFLYVANEDSDTIVALRIDQESGRLNPTGHVVKTGSPVCIVFRPL